MIMNKLNMASMEQGSPEWISARIGNISASNFWQLLVAGRGKTRDAYLRSVVSEVISGKPAEHIKTWDMIRGNELEPYARLAYEKATGLKVDQIGLVYLDDRKNVSCSPDGMVVLDNRIERGVEIKCPNPKKHVEYITGQHDIKKHAPQMQGGMWIVNADRWDFVSFCPEFQECPLYIEEVYRDSEMISRIEIAVKRALLKVGRITRQILDLPKYDVGDLVEEAKNHLDIIFSSGDVDTTGIEIE